MKSPKIGLALVAAIVAVLGLFFLNATKVNSPASSPEIPEKGSGNPPLPEAETFQIRIGETKQIFGATGIRALKVFEDSRCPKDVVCVWAGRAGFLIEVSAGSETEKLKVYSDGVPVIFKNFASVKLVQVLPETSAGVKINESDYVLTLEAKKI